MGKALVDDVSIYPILLELLSCLEAEYADADEEMVGVLAAGEFVPPDVGTECERIVGYVRVFSGYPSMNAFPSPEPTAKCGTPLAYQVYVGVIRCSYDIQDDASVDVEEMNDFTRTQLADQAAIRRAIQCCLGSKFEDQKYSLGAWQPGPVGGGIGGGEWQLAIQEL